MSMNINECTNATHTKAFSVLELLLYIVWGVNAKWIYLGINAKFFLGGLYETAGALVAYFNWRLGAAHSE